MAPCTTPHPKVPLLTVLAQWQFPTDPQPTVFSTTSLQRIITLTNVHRNSSDLGVLGLAECA